MMEFNLTNSQQSALRAFESFLDGEEQVFMLKGAAGTGKTTLLSELLKVLKGKSRPFRLMAPTGRAAFILGNKTGIGAVTIHKGIYALSKLKRIGKKDEDDTDEKLHLRFALQSNEDSPNAVYIVDEASMVSDAFSENEAFSFGSGCLLSDLFRFAEGRKIVFVGDYAQLPPVGMNSSPALDNEYVEKKFDCAVREVMLREVMRQTHQSSMLKNALAIRDSIEAKSFVEFKVESGEDSVSEGGDMLKPYYALFPDKPSSSSAVIAYSNRQALNYNIAIRSHYYGEDAPRLKAGDLLMISRNNYSYETELFNGNVVLVESCQPDSEVTTRAVTIKVGRDKTKCVRLNFRQATIAFKSGTEKKALNVMLLDNFLDDPNGSVGGILAQALIVDFEKRLTPYLKENMPEIRKALRHSGNLTLRQKEIYDAYIHALQKDPYYNAVICKYGYAMTCHKAQGGEWPYVFVDMCRFGGTANEDYFRWAYTALTRASNKVWHYHSPDFNYIGGLVVEEIKPSSNLKISMYSENEDFRSVRFSRIQRLGAKHGLTVVDDLSKPYQHLVSFSDSYLNHAKYQLWYSNKGYSAKDVLMNSSSDEFTSLCDSIISESNIPPDVPFSSPDRPFAEKLVSFVRSQIEETGISLLNITQGQYQDVFHLKTDGVAQVALYYTSKGNYTYMRLLSSLGPMDAKLQEFRRRFI